MSNELSNNDISPIGVYNFRNQRKKFGIKVDDRRRHVYVIGKTGVGKTTLLENMVIADIQSGKGIGVIDPHGEFAEKMLDFVPEERLDDVIYFDPSDMENPVAFNPMEQVGTEFRHLVASGLMGVFKKIWADAWSARMQYILNNTLLALLEYPDATLLGIMQMFSNKVYRKKIVDNLQDPIIKSFWRDEFSKYSEKFETEALAAIQNKVGQFTSNPLVRNILGQPRSSLNMRDIMDSGKIFIANLSKGKIGEDNSALLGAMIITRLQLAAMSRVDLPEDKRRDFFLYVDEFQNFATDSFANILSEARKYRLGLILAHQYISQLTGPEGNTKVRDAVFGNVGTIISFRVGAEDAEFLEKEFMPEFLQTDLVNLAKANIYIKLMIDGVASRPFSAETIAPQKMPFVTYRDVIIKNSRDRYGTPRKIVEERIMSELPGAQGGDAAGAGAGGGSTGNLEERMERRGERRLAEVLRPGSMSNRSGAGSHGTGNTSFAPRSNAAPRASAPRPAGERQYQSSAPVYRPSISNQNHTPNQNPNIDTTAPAQSTMPVEQPPQLTPIEAAAGVKHPPEPKKFPKPNVDIEALRRAIHESLKKKKMAVSRMAPSNTMRFHLLTIFPEIFNSYLGESLFKRAQKEKLIAIKSYDLRDFTTERHRKVDDRPFGGGPGMVLQVQPVYKAVEAIKAKTRGKNGVKKKVRTILFSTRGKKFDAKTAKRLSKYDDIILICGRYEGVDERVAQYIADEEISIGDYILSGGELPALVLVEAVSRFIPGFLGKQSSLEEVNGSFPTYSRPEIFTPKKGKKWAVPKVLLSGDHKQIEEWRKKQPQA